MAILKNTVINDTSGLRIPTGTTAQRPANPVDGDCRYNTDVGHVEYYYKGFWVDARTSKNGLEKNGLQLFLDISNPDSYPGNGTTWFDISDNGRNFSFNAAPSIGTDDDVVHYTTSGRIATGPASNSFGITNTSGHTVVMVMKQISNIATASFNWYNAYGRGIFAHSSWSDGQHYYDTARDSTGNLSRVNTGAAPFGVPISNRWAVWCYRSLGDKRGQSIWRNGEKIAGEANVGTQGNLDLNGTAAQVGNTTEYGNTWDARLNSFLMYNRGLTDEEIINLTVAFRFRDGF